MKTLNGASVHSGEEFSFQTLFPKCDLLNKNHASQGDIPYSEQVGPSTVRGTPVAGVQ